MTMMQTMGAGPMAGLVPPERHDRIIHARMKLGDGEPMASDVPGDGKVGVTLSIGVVKMPLQETFWAKRFGMMTDRYGIRWMVNCETPPTA